MLTNRLSAMQKKVSKNDNRDTKISPNTIYTILGGVVLLRLLMTFLPSYKVDMGGYRAWSTLLARKGFTDFYDNFHVVYAPFYMYFLWMTGCIARIFSISIEAHEFLIKTWAVASDILGGYLIYLIGKKYGRDKEGFILGIVYAMNPAVFFNSSIWGQFDSIPATMLLAVIYCFNTRRSVAAAILFGISVLTKPQSVVLAPVVLILYFDRLSLKKVLLTLVGGISAYILITLPFASWRSVFWVIEHYITSGGDYPYATANGFNFWTLVNGQIQADNLPFLGLTYAKWSIILLLFAALISILAIVRNRHSAYAIYFTSYFISFAVFMFGTRMHERYLFPAFIFLMVCILWNRRLWYVAGVLSLCHLINQWYIYSLSFKEIFWVSPQDTLGYIVAAITMLVMIDALYEMYKLITLKKVCVTISKNK